MSFFTIRVVLIGLPCSRENMHDSVVELTTSGTIATLTLSRGKVNALNPPFVSAIQRDLDSLASDEAVRAAILTGRGSFFSFGFDIPEFLQYSKDEFKQYLESFTALYTSIFVHPKPIIAALNGHTIAGGAMLATACDYRIMTTGNAKISLNEISLGSTLFAGSVEMLEHLLGTRRSATVALSGAMYSAEEALELGWIEETCKPEQLKLLAKKRATAYAEKDAVAFQHIKMLLRGPVAERMRKREADSIQDFVNIWYSEATRRNLKKIQIRD
jgi:3,2-trans-enoyl-CoA isomerase